MRERLLVLFMLMAAACGGGNSLESEYEALENKPAAPDAATAKAQYEEAQKFVEKLRQEEEPPEGLLEDAMLLQGQRALEWAKAGAREKLTTGFGEIFGALRSSGVSAEDAGAQDPEVEKYLSEERLKQVTSDDLEDYKYKQPEQQPTLEPEGAPANQQ